MIEIRVQFLRTLSGAIWYSSLSLLYLPALSFHPSSVFPSLYLIPSHSFLHFLYYESQIQMSRLSFLYKLLFYFYEQKYQHRTMPENKQTNPAVHPAYDIEHKSLLILHACLWLLEGLINTDCIAKPYLYSVWGSFHIPSCWYCFVLKIIKLSNEVAPNFTGEVGRSVNFYWVILKTWLIVHYNFFLGITCLHLEQERNRLSNTSTSKVLE